MKFSGDVMVEQVTTPTLNLWVGLQALPNYVADCERFEPRSHFKRLSLIVRVNVVLNRTAVVVSD